MSEKQSQERQLNVDKDLKMRDSHEKLREMLKGADG